MATETYTQKAVKWPWNTNPSVRDQVRYPLGGTIETVTKVDKRYIYLSDGRRFKK